MQSASRRLYRKLWARNKRRTLRGFLDEKYHAMTLRVSGKPTNRYSSAVGLPIISKDTFLTWAYAQGDLVPMFEKYKQSGWERNLCPTIDRINNLKGYTIDNIQFLTMVDNLKKDNWRKRRPSKVLHKRNKSGHKYVCWNKRDSRWLVVKGKYIGQYKTLEEASAVAKQVELEVGKSWAQTKD